MYGAIFEMKTMYIVSREDDVQPLQDDWDVVNGTSGTARYL